MTVAPSVIGGHAELGLDVDAEVEVLAHAPLQGPWQAPAELVRFLLARGAAAVDVELSSGRYRVAGSDAAVSPDDLVRLVAVLDRRTAAGARHAAVVELEATEAMPLLWAAGAAGVRLRFRLATPSATIVASGRRGRPVEVVHAGAAAAGRIELEVRGPGFDRRRAAEWLRAACRFARARVRLDGVELGAGLREGAFRAHLDEPVPCDVAIGTDGDAPTLWLLRHGVVAARATVPGFPPFHAAVELAAVTPPGASPAEVRAAVQPYLTDLIGAAVQLMARAAARLPELADERRRALTLALLRAASIGLCRQEILELPLVLCGPPEQPARPLSLAELARAERPPPAASELELARLGLRGPRSGAVLRLGPEERELVMRLTGVRLTPPPAAVAAGVLGWLRRPLRWPPAVKGWIAVVFAGIVAEDLLSPGEAELAAAIRRWSRPPVGEAEVAFVAGRGRPTAYRRHLRLARRDPRTVAAVRALAQGPAWRYPVLLAVVPADWAIDPGVADAWWADNGLST